MSRIDTDIKGVTCEEEDAIRVKPKQELWVNNTKLAAGVWVTVPKNFDLLWMCEVEEKPVAVPEEAAADNKKEDDNDKDEESASSDELEVKNSRTKKSKTPK